MTLITSSPQCEPARRSDELDGGRSSSINRVMIAIVAITLAANFLLMSAARGTKMGHQPWRPGSILRAVTELLAFNYQWATYRGAEIKWLAQGLGAAAALLAGAAAWFARTGPDREDLDSAGWRPGLGRAGTAGAGTLSEITPAAAAQIAIILLVGWVMLSALWAPWPEAALGEGVRQLIVTVWAVALGRTLGPRGARGAALAVVVVLTITAILGVWYHFERNPVLRLEFPIGNPIFLAACLVPGITLTMAWLTGAVFSVLRWSRRALWAPAGVWPGLVQRRVWFRQLIGSGLGLALLAWAFKLTGSRGPMIGLAVGVVVVTYVVAPRRVRWVLVGALVLTAAAVWWFRLWPVSYILSRPDTIRVRLCAWKYAIALFLQRPVFGCGQGAYLLRAQHMSRPDAISDPIAFPAPLFGRAHNEWLEILAELGAVGFALCVTALGLTFWSATIALRRTSNASDRWCLIGLLAAFVALVAEETTSVALRMPGLPVVFYTVIGLIWAVSREPSPAGRAPPPARGRVVRLAVLAAAVAGSGGIAAAAWRDWQGALATTAIGTYAQKQQWEKAIGQADRATTYRLVLEDRLWASECKARVACEAAAQQVRQIERMIARVDDQGSRPRTSVLQLAGEDSARFGRYFHLCLETGKRLLRRIPAYPRVAGMIADLWLLRQRIEMGQQQLGLRDQVYSYVPIARHWMQIEYDGDPLDGNIGLRLFVLSGDQPLGKRIDLLRVPLRSGPILPGVESALAALVEGEGFEWAMNRRLDQARAALDKPNAAAWADRYAPETLRLGALASTLQGEFDRAAALAGDAVTLCERIRPRFPAAASYARLDQARYLLLAYPQDAGRAVEACRQAIADWPSSTARQAELEPLRWDLARYLLAAGDEQAARTTLLLIDRKLTPEELDHQIGYALAELCRVFVASAPGGRPMAFGNWLRRSMQLAPQGQEGRRIAAYVALERGDGATAVEHIEALEKISAEPQRATTFVRALLSEFPDSQALHAYVASRMRPGAPETQPFFTAPVTSGPAVHETFPDSLE